MKGAVFTALFLFWRKQMTKIGKLEIGAGQVRICAPIAYTTEEEIYASLAEIRAKKPDLAEWRIDCFSDYRDAGKVNRVLSRIREELAPIPVLCTLRTSDEGGEAALLPAEYKDFYKELCRASRPDAIDVETITKLETAPEIIQMAKALGVTVIASNHEFTRALPEEELLRRLAVMDAAGADILKIAVMPKTADDTRTVLESAKAYHRKGFQKPIILIAMGELGKDTRTRAGEVGIAVTFATIGKASAPGQISIDELREIQSRAAGNGDEAR